MRGADQASREPLGTEKGPVPVLSVEGLTVSYRQHGREVPALRDVSCQVYPGEVVGMVGESGCGKSTLAFSIMGYLPSNGRIAAGRIRFRGENLLTMNRKQMRSIRGRRISIVPQDPLTSLNPSYRVGEQVAEVLRTHKDLSKRACRREVIGLLEDVGLPEPELIAERFPHQISGGQQQRILIAIAFSLRPDLIIMDEPTTGLDVTTQAVILELIRDMKRVHDASILYVTHNLGVVKNICDRIVTIYAGEVVEQGDVVQVFERPKHPYTYALLRSIPDIRERAHTHRLAGIGGSLPDPFREAASCAFAPRCERATEQCFSEHPDLLDVADGGFSRCFFADQVPRNQATAPIDEEPVIRREATPLLEVQEASKHFTTRRGTLRAVDQVGLTCGDSEVWGIVGESGCGKTTLARCISGLLAIDEGRIAFQERDISSDYRSRPRDLLQSIQMVFQNPQATLNPQKTVRQTISRALSLHRDIKGDELSQKVVELLELVRLGENYLEKLPHELSGGEKQRVGIARALAPGPKLVVCDEPISNLDVSIQAEVLNLLADLQRDLKIAYLFISHNLSVVRYLSDMIMVMYLGRICEQGTPEDIFDPPYHPYTESLLSALPLVHTGVRQRRVRLEGAVPSATEEIPGCAFHSRCPKKVGAICEDTPPPLRRVNDNHFLYCHIPLEELASERAVFVFRG